jgi:hypothetical protein
MMATSKRTFLDSKKTTPQQPQQLTQLSHGNSVSNSVAISPLRLCCKRRCGVQVEDTAAVVSGFNTRSTVVARTLAPNAILRIGYGFQTGHRDFIRAFAAFPKRPLLDAV